MSDELEAAFDGLLAELNGVKAYLKTPESPLDVHVRDENLA